MWFNNNEASQFCTILFHENSFLPRAYTRETREGWPLLTVETEVNGDLKSTNERGPSLVGSLGLSCWCYYNRFFPHRTLLQFLVPHPPARWAGRRARSPVSKYVSMAYTKSHFIIYCILLRQFRMYVQVQ